MLFENAATIGIDLGTTGLRAVEIAMQDGKPVVQRWATVDFDGEINDWQAIDAAAIGQLLRSSLEKNGMRGYWASHSVVGDAVAPQYFSFPSLLSEDIAEAVRIEVEAGLPFRAEDALISYVLFPDHRLDTAPAPADEPDTPATGEKTEAARVRTHGLALAADSGMVESRLAVIRLAGLETFCVEADSTACGNAFLATGNPDESDGTTAILNVGHRFSTLTLLHQGTILIRDIPVGGQHVTNAIAESLSIKRQEAEELKRNHWDKGPSMADALEPRMDEILNACMRELTDRLQDTVQHWGSEQLIPLLSRVLLTGGGAQIRPLPQFLSRALGVPVEHWSPIPEDPSRKGEALAPWRYRMAVAFGLALRTFPGRRR